MSVLTWSAGAPSAEVLASSVTAPVTSTTVISGVSLVPVMVTTTVEVSVEDSLAVSTPLSGVSREKTLTWPDLSPLPSFWVAPMATRLPSAEREMDEPL